MKIHSTHTAPRVSILCAFFAALTAGLSQISIFLGPVPFNLATFSVLLSGAVLGAKHGSLSQVIYVLLGVCGIPVFAGFRAGFIMLAGPTGGFIFGYMLAPAVVGLICGKRTKPLSTGLAMLCGFFTYMTTGALWFMYVTGADFLTALTVCVLPFILGDAAKICAAAFIAVRIRGVYPLLYIK